MNVSRPVFGYMLCHCVCIVLYCHETECYRIVFCLVVCGHDAHIKSS